MVNRKSLIWNYFFLLLHLNHSWLSKSESSCSIQVLRPKDLCSAIAKLNPSKIVEFDEEENSRRNSREIFANIVSVTDSPLKLRLRGGKAFAENTAETDHSGECSEQGHAGQGERLVAETEISDDNEEYDIDVLVLEDGDDQYAGQPHPADGDLVNIELELWADGRQILDSQGAMAVTRQFNSHPEPDATAAPLSSLGRARWETVIAELGGYVPPQMLYAYGGKYPGNASAWRSGCGGALPRSCRARFSASSCCRRSLAARKACSCTSTVCASR